MSNSNKVKLDRNPIKPSLRSVSFPFLDTFHLIARWLLIFVFPVNPCGQIPSNLKQCTLARISLRLVIHIAPYVFYLSIWLDSSNLQMCRPWGPGKMQEPKLLADPIHSLRVLQLSSEKVSLICLPLTLRTCLGLFCYPALVAPWSLSNSYLARRKANPSLSDRSSILYYFEITISLITQTLHLKESTMWVYPHHIRLFICLVITYIWWCETWRQEASSGAIVGVSRWCRRVSSLAQTTTPSFYLVSPLGYWSDPCSHLVWQLLEVAVPLVLIHFLQVPGNPLEEAFI